MTQHRLEASAVATGRIGPTDFPWAVLPSSVARRGDRRLEASSYLTDGYGQRQLIEAKAGGWRPLEVVADVWQPARLKGVTVPSRHGLPFLSAGQVFESDPVVRKWLARDRVPHLQSRYVLPGWLLMTCSGDVGKVVPATDTLGGIVVTHDLLRVVPKSPRDQGWLYAYMRTPLFQSIARTSQYGHMIKHLEPEHVRSMPVVWPSKEARDSVGSDVAAAFKFRDQARRLRDAAFALYESLVGGVGPAEPSVTSIVLASDIARGRRRLDAAYMSAEVRAAEAAIDSAPTTSVERLDDITLSVSVGPRFKRFFGVGGTPYLSAANLFDRSVPVTKRVYAALLEDADRYILREGWIVMACSGQTYGINGRAMILSHRQNGLFGSHDLIRILPNAALARPGYVLTALTHPTLGRPLVLRNAYGTSIPHLDPVDIRNVRIPRFSAGDENQVANLQEEATRLTASADELEEGAVRVASELIAEHAGESSALSDAVALHLATDDV